MIRKEDIQIRKKTVYINYVVIALIIAIGQLQIIAWAQVPEIIKNKHGEKIANQSTLNKEKKLQALKNAPQLYTQNNSTIYQNETLNNIDFHVGSIGGGAIRLDGKGRLHIWQIFNNLTELPLPDSFFAIRCQERNKPAIIRQLNTVGQKPFVAMQSIKLVGEFPFATYHFQDSELPVSVTMEAYSPFIPLDLKNSTLPVAIFNFTIVNNSSKAQQVSLLHSQQNAIGYRPVHGYDGDSWNNEFNFGENFGLKKHHFVIQGIHYPHYGTNINQIKINPNSVQTLLSSQLPVKHPDHATLATALLSEHKNVVFTGKNAWHDINQLYSLWKKHGAFSKQNSRSAPSPKGQTHNVATNAQFTLQAKASLKVTAIIAWHAPNGSNGGIINAKWSEPAWGGRDVQGKGWGGKGNAYQQYWSNAQQVLNYAQRHLIENENNTRNFHRALYSTSLPYWMKDRFSSQLAILTSKTLFWTADDYVGGWEGTGPGDGSCAGNCGHVWHYAQSHARLFPYLARRMLEQQFFYQKPNGAIPYRQPAGDASADCQAASILQAYREHLLQTDEQWLKQYFPAIKKAMNYFINTWDADRDGRLSGSQHTTLDCAIGGNSSWIGSLYAAALKAGSKMAMLCGDKQNAKLWDILANKAIQSHTQELFNGEYFIQKPQQRSFRDYHDGCLLDQMLGQWWAYQLGLGILYPPKQFVSAMQSIFKYNFRPDFKGIRQVPREFVQEEDAGMQIITWPKGKRPNAHTAYADEVMSGFEYATIANMVYAGLKEQAFVCAKAIADRYDGRLRQGYRGAWGNWGFSGNPFGDDECGKMYSRALSNWSILLAYQGFTYDGPKQAIGFMPAFKEKKHRSFFSTAQGWGTFQQLQQESKTLVEIQLDYGQLNLKQLKLAVDVHKKISTIAVKQQGKPLPIQYNQQGNRLHISLQTQLKANTRLKITIHYK